MARYGYDALGRRTRKTVIWGENGQQEETRFLWEGFRLLQARHADRTESYIYDPNVWWSPLARISQQSGERDGDIRWFNTDLNGAPLEMTDADGSVRWSGDYSSFGAVNGQTQDSEGLRHGKPVESQPLRYAGQYADEETGLHYNLFRYYDPTVGRFTTQDPIGLAGGINLYTYAPNPLGWVDPLGLTPTWVPASEVNYSQRTVSNVLSDGKTTIADLSNSMKENGFNLAKGKPLNVMVVDGQYVSYDNRRLLAAQNAGIDVPINIVNSEDIHPDSTTGKTWGEKFRERRNHKWNKIAGGVVPEKGISNKPTCL